MNVLFLAFVLGAFKFQFASSLPNINWALSSVLVLGFIFFLSYLLFPKQKILLKIIAIFLSVTLGFLWAEFRAQSILNWNLDKNLEVKNILIEGNIATLPKIDEKHENFIFEFQKTRISLNWYNNFRNLTVGDKWQLLVRLKRPHGTMNPGGFDYEKYLFENGIRATGYVVESAENKFLESHWYQHPIDRIRQYLKTKIENSINNYPEKNIVKALIVGDQSGITSADWEVLRKTGTIHFMIIAGLHIGFVAGFLFFLGKFLWARSRKLPLIIPAPIISALCAIVGALIYSALAGFSVPTLRAFVMILVFMLGILLRREISNWQSLIFALFLVTLLNPNLLLTSGFWLSFFAVFLIMYTLDGKLRTDNKIIRFGKLQFALTFGLLPLSLLLFQEASLVSLFANAIAIPWIGFIIIPLSMIGTCLLLINAKIGHFVLVLACEAAHWIWIFLQYLAELHYASFKHAIYNPWILTSSIIGTLLLLAPRGIPHRFVGIFWIFPLFFYSPAPPKNGEVWFTLLDVGQGLASVIRTEHHVLIYDTGPKFYDGGDSGQTIVIPFLENFGINKVDMLVVSHSDSDHSGGAESILNTLPVENLLTSTPDFFKLHPANNCLAGQSFTWDGVNFTFLHPPQNSLFSINDASCVLKVTTGKNSILLTGDIEENAEEFIIEHNKENLKATILVVPHHGSKSSSSEQFIEAVKPNYALFATGYLNRFHFPSLNVVARYKENNAILLNTEETGAITFKFSGNSMKLIPELYRIENQHYYNEITTNTY